MAYYGIPSNFLNSFTYLSVFIGVHLGTIMTVDNPPFTLG